MMQVNNKRHSTHKKRQLRDRACTPDEDGTPDEDNDKLHGRNVLDLNFSFLPSGGHGHGKAIPALTTLTPLTSRCSSSTSISLTTSKDHDHVLETSHAVPATQPNNINNCREEQASDPMTPRPTSDQDGVDSDGATNEGGDDSDGSPRLPCDIYIEAYPSIMFYWSRMFNKPEYLSSTPYQVYQQLYDIAVLFFVCNPSYKVDNKCKDMVQRLLLNLVTVYGPLFRSIDTSNRTWIHMLHPMDVHDHLFIIVEDINKRSLEFIQLVSDLRDHHATCDSTNRVLGSRGLQQIVATKISPEQMKKKNFSKLTEIGEALIAHFKYDNFVLFFSQAYQEEDGQWKVAKYVVEPPRHLSESATHMTTSFFLAMSMRLQTLQTLMLAEHGYEFMMKYSFECLCPMCRCSGHHARDFTT